MYSVEEVLRACGVGLLCSFCIIIVGKMSGNAAATVKTCGSVVLFGMLLLGMRNALGELEKIFIGLPINQDSFYKPFSLMLKALGIALISRFCADICRDCGENTLGNGIESVGRIAIFSLCLPVISDIIGYATQVMEMAG